MRTRSGEVWRPLFGVKKNFLMLLLWHLSTKKRGGGEFLVCVVRRWGTGGAASHYTVVRQKGMQLCNHYVFWGEKGYIMHCSTLFCSWFEVRMLLWPLTIFTDGYESHLTIHNSRLCEGNAIGAFVLTNKYIVLWFGGWIMQHMHTPILALLVWPC